MHPRYFDRQALTACWREALLAQAVLVGNTKGYGHHPQLLRFRDQPSPPDSIGAFLEAIVDEADARGYAFNRTKILRPQQSVEQIPVTVDQLSYEWQHLRAKLALRRPAVAAKWQEVTVAEPHPLFTAVAGPIAPWERPKG